MWQKIADDLPIFDEYWRALFKLEPGLGERVLKLDGKPFDFAMWLIEKVIQDHHCFGYPLALPESLLEMFLERLDTLYPERGYTGVVTSRKACAGCGYGMPYRFWKKLLKGPHAECAYDIPAEHLPPLQDATRAV